MNLRFSLADKISIALVIVGIFAVLQAYYISDAYKNFSYQHQQQIIEQLAYIEINDLIDKLKADSLDLAQSIEHEHKFKSDFKLKNINDLTQQLDNQFRQYFVSAGVIKLLKLYILDTDFTLLSTSSEGINTDKDSGLICPRLSQLALSRKGSERLQTMSRSCIYKNHPVFAIIIPFGGLDPKGYIQIVTDLAHNLQKIEHALAMPVQMSTIDGYIIYRSKDWQVSTTDADHLITNLTVVNDDAKTIMNIDIKSDLTAFNNTTAQHRNQVMVLASVITAITVFIALLILRHSSIAPVTKIHNTLEKIHSQATDDDKISYSLFEHLLEQVIRLRQRYKTRFCVMILDLTHFKKVSQAFGGAVEKRFFIEVEQRLNAILRESDLILWTGNSILADKLLSSETKTQYRTTIARLEKNKFGLILPSACTEEQALAIAKRIVETLNKPFFIQEDSIEIDCRIGISIYPTHGEDEKALIAAADNAVCNTTVLEQNVFIFKSDKTETHLSTLPK